MMPHPFMPDLSTKSLDDIVKEINGIYEKMRMVSNPMMRQQIQLVLNGYQEAYHKKLAEEANKPKDKKKHGRLKDE